MINIDSIFLHVSKEVENAPPEVIDYLEKRNNFRTKNALNSYLNNHQISAAGPVTIQTMDGPIVYAGNWKAYRRDRKKRIAKWKATEMEG